MSNHETWLALGALAVIVALIVILRKLSTRATEDEPETIRIRGPMRYHVALTDRKRIRTVTAKWFGRRPQVQDGMVRLSGKLYELDSDTIFITEGRRARSLWLLPFDQPNMIWRENDPVPKDIMAIMEDQPMPEWQTGARMDAFTRMRFIEKLRGQRTDWFVLILLVAVGLLFGFVIGQYNATNGGVP